MEPKKEPSNTLIYVSNLPFETNDEQLRDLFKGFNIKTAYVAKRKNGKSKGFGFVNLEKESDQNAAIERVNGSDFNSRKLIAKVAMNDERRNEKGELKEEFRSQQTNQVASETVVYVSNLAWSVNNEELKKIFSEFNPKVVTVATRRNGRSKGFGFVEFNNKEDREKALSLDQKSFHERTITVKPSTGYRGDRPRDRSRDNRRRNRSRDNNRRSRDNRNRSRDSRRSRENNRRSRDNNRNRSRDNNRNRDNNNNNNQNKTENKPKTENTVIGAEILSKPKKQNNKQTNNNKNNNQNKTKDTKTQTTTKTEKPKTENNQTNKQNNTKTTNKPKETQTKTENKPKTEKPKTENKPKTQTTTKTEKKPKSDSFSKVVSNTRRTTNKSKKSTPTTENKSNNETSSNNDNSNRTNERPREKRSEFTLYVKNLPFEIDDKDLTDIFKEFHPKSARIATTSSGKSKGYGFVEFKNEKDQNDALRALDQSEINERLVSVKVSSGKRERRNRSRSGRRNRSRSGRRNERRNERRNRSGSRSSNNRQPSTTTVHVSNLEFSIDDKDLAEIFKGLQIAKAYVVKNQSGRSKGFGFVEFSNAEDQQQSIKKTGVEVKGRSIRVQASYVRDN